MTNQNAFNYAWKFIKNNWELTVLTILVEIGFTILGFIPIVGVLFGLLLGLVVFNEQIYFGKAVIASRDNEEKIEDFSHKAKLEDFLFKYLGIAIGSYLAFLIIFIVIGAVFVGLSIASMGESMYYMSNLNSLSGGNLDSLMASVYSWHAGILELIIMLLLLIVIGMISYIYPAIMGEVIKSNSFGEAFQKTFWLFNVNFWKKSFNKRFFMFVFIWSLIVLGLVAMGGIWSVDKYFIPLGMFVFYFLGLYNGAVFVFASDLLEDENEAPKEN